MPTLALLVTGHGEVECLPILLRRMLHELGRFDIQLATPHRRQESKLFLRGSDALERWSALCVRGHDGLLVLADDEDGAPCTDGPELQRRVDAALRGLPAQVVLAYREFETWFLHDAEHLLGAAVDFDPEGRRDAKKHVTSRLGQYNPTEDGPGLVARLRLDVVRKRSDSFRVLGDRLRALAESMPEPRE